MIFSVPCSAGTPAPLIVPLSAWNVRLGRRTEDLGLGWTYYSVEANTQRLHQKTKKFPSPDPFPNPHTPPHILSLPFWRKTSPHETQFLERP